MPGLGRTWRTALGATIFGALLLLAPGAPASGAGEAPPRKGVLAATGGGRYEVMMQTVDAEGRTLFGSKAELEVAPVEPGAWRVRLLGASLWDPYQTVWQPLLVDSVDPRTDNLPEGVELEFIVDGAPDMQRLFPHDIPASVFGLLVEASTMLALCSEAGGLDDLEEPGDTASFSGFELLWRRPYTAPVNRRVIEAGASTLERIEDGVTTVQVRPRQVRWAMVRGSGEFQLSIGSEAYAMEVRLDAATGELLAIEVPESVMTFQRAGPLETPEIPADAEARVPKGEERMVTHRALSLRRVAEDAPQ